MNILPFPLKIWLKLLITSSLNSQLLPSLGGWSLAVWKAEKDREENPALHWQSGHTWTSPAQYNSCLMLPKPAASSSTTPARAQHRHPAPRNFTAAAWESDQKWPGKGTRKREKDLRSKILLPPVQTCCEGRHFPPPKKSSPSPGRAPAAPGRDRGAPLPVAPVPTSAQPFLHIQGPSWVWGSPLTIHPGQRCGFVPLTNWDPN